MSCTNRRHSGFTLVELMISTTVASVVLVSVAVLMANIGSNAAVSEKEQYAKDDLGSALDMIRYDIERAGGGMPLDVATLDTLSDMPDADYEIQVMTNFSIRDLDPNENAGDGPDELFLGGTSVSYTYASNIVTVVSQVIDADTIEVVRIDGPGIDATYAPSESLLDPYVLTVYGNYGADMLTLIGPKTWRNTYPMKINNNGIRAIAGASGADEKLEIDITAGSIGTSRLRTPPAEGDYVYFYRYLQQGTGIWNPSVAPASRWYLDPLDNTLKRQWLHNPGFAPWDAGGSWTVPNFAYTYAGPTIEVLQNVVDFQVAFLVWPCGGNQPIWVNHLLDEPNNTGEFGAAGAPAVNGYNNGANYEAQADRFMALRQRLLGVRISLLVEIETDAETSDPTFPGGTVQDLQIENHVNVLADLDPTRRYLSIQQVYDPTNLRLKTPATSQESRPPVRSVVTDQDTWDASNGFCRGRTT